MGKKEWEVVSLPCLKGWLSPGDKQVRFDSSRPSLLKPHSSSPVPKTVPFLRKKNTVGFIFLSPHNEFCFVAFLLSLFLVSILLVFSWPGQVPMQNCPRKSQGHFSGILGKFLRVNSVHQNSLHGHFTSDLFFQSTFITRTTITGKEYKQKKQTKI